MPSPPLSYTLPYPSTSTGSTPDDPAFLRKVSHHLSLSAVTRAVIARLLSANVRLLRPRAMLADRGIRPTEISVVLSGWAARIADLGGGRRQVTAFFLPGDICNLDSFLLGHTDQSIVSISDLTVAHFGQSTLDTLSQRSPEASRAFLWEMASTFANQRRWTVNVARRGAQQRIANLIGELWDRLDAVGLVRPEGAVFPLTQTDIADACGLTAEHTNRTLQKLRADQVLYLEEQTLRVPDRGRLSNLAGEPG